jgi:hypothetical protein
VTPFAQHRCWNHEAREAVCRCPSCGRPYCKECVSEHDSRLLCAPCLMSQTTARSARRSRLAPVAMLLAGLFLAWTFFYGAGRALALIGSRAEEAASQSK